MPKAVPAGAAEADARTSSVPRAALAVSAACALLAVAATLPPALELPLWQDEVASARVLLEPSPSGVVAHVARTESTPPGWYLLAWTGRRAGLSVESLRLLSVALAAALSGLAVLYARRFLPLWTAGLAGVLTALAWQTVAHGQELRAYALLTLLTLALAVLVERAAEAPTGGRLALLALCAALGAYTHYFFVLSAAAGALWVLSEPALRASAARVAGAVALGTAALLAWLPGLAEQVGAERFGWIDVFDPLKLAYVHSALFWNPGPLFAEDGSSPEPGEALGRLAILGLVAYGSTVLWRIDARARLCALMALAPVALAGLAWLAGLRIITGRNLIGVLLFAAVALAAVLLPLPRRAVPLGVAAAVSLAAVGYLRSPVDERVPFDEVASALVAEGWAPGDPLLVFGSFTDFRSPLEWYLPGEVVLEEAVPERRCEEVYVVTDIPDGRSFVEGAPVRSRAETGPVLVARVGWEGRLVGEAERLGGRYAAADGAAGCLRPLEERVT